MKLRLKGSSVRLRLSKTEVETLAHSGLLEESVEFTPHPLIYVLHSSKDCRDMQVSFLNGWITVTIPETRVKSWAEGEEVGMEGTFRGISLLIEKDWACLHGDPESNVDTFAHP